MTFVFCEPQVMNHWFRLSVMENYQNHTHASNLYILYGGRYVNETTAQCNNFLYQGARKQKHIILNQYKFVTDNWLLLPLTQIGYKTKSVWFQTVLVMHFFFTTLIKDKNLKCALISLIVRRNVPPKNEESTNFMEEKTLKFYLRHIF